MTHALVTGGAGFIGSHLTEALLARGDQVTVLDDCSTGKLENLQGITSNPRLTIVRGTAMDRGLVASLVAECDVVFHLAAAVGVQLIASNPIHTIETNIYPTELVLQEARRCMDRGKPIRIFLASTSEVYGKNPAKSWTEDADLLFGPTTRARWSYGVSKAIDEFLALAHWRECQLPVVIGRFFNTVGPRQTGQYGMVLPRFVDAALEGGPLLVHDDGQQVRCFSHVRDTVTAVLALMDRPEAHGQVFNIGSDQPVTILDLAKGVVAAVNPKARVEFQSYAAAYSDDFEDVRIRIPDLTKLRKLTGFRPSYDLQAIIQEVVAWKRASRGT